MFDTLKERCKVGSMGLDSDWVKNSPDRHYLILLYALKPVFTRDCQMRDWGVIPRAPLPTHEFEQIASTCPPFPAPLSCASPILLESRTT